MSRFLALLAVPLALAAACSSSTSTSTSPAPSPPSSATAATPPPVYGGDLLQAFATAGLPTGNVRETTTGCTDYCAQRVTSDSVTVTVALDEAVASRLVAAGSAHRVGRVVLGYAGARTPETLRPRYEAELARFCSARPCGG